MIQERITLWKAGEYTYPAEGNFIPFLMAFLHEEDDEKRPGIVVVPGGAYCMVSPTEGEVVAKRFYDKGYNTFVLVYTTNPFMKNRPPKLQPLKDLSRAFVMIRKQAETLHIDEHALIVCGFSAGGHLSSSLCVHYDASELAETGEYAGISSRPDLAVLCYPVITSGLQAHRGSFDALLGADASEAELEYMSSELHVTENTPPAFLWTTFTDEGVPWENSLLYAEALRKAGVPAELHVFAEGPHGMSLADDAWAYESLKAFYCMEQMMEAMQVLVDNGRPLPPPYNRAGEIPKGTKIRQVYAAMMQNPQPVGKPDPAIAVWPELADAWLAGRRGGHPRRSECKNAGSGSGRKP